MAIYCFFRNGSASTDISIILTFIILLLLVINLIVNMYFIVTGIDEYRVEVKEEVERRRIIDSLKEAADDDMDKSFVRQMKQRALRFNGNNADLDNIS